MDAPTVEPMDVSVQMATMPCSDIPEALYHLLQLFLFSSEEPRFLSISVVEATTITIVAEPAALASLRSGVPSIVQDEVEWAVVRVAEGVAGFDSVGVVERLTEPLAKQRIPVLYTSTHSTDYLLIPQHRLDDALECLERHSSDAAADAATDTAADAAAAEWSSESDANCRHTYPLTVMDGVATQVLRLEKQHRHRHTGALLRLLFMPQRDDAPHALASLTETADEISLIASDGGWWADYCREEGLLSGMQDDPSQGWVPIRVGDEHGTPLEETGVIACQAKVLASANLSILYLSTFYSDFTLVQRADVERAEAAFDSAGFVCSRSSSASAHGVESSWKEAYAMHAQTHANGGLESNGAPNGALIQVIDNLDAPRGQKA